VLRNKNWEWRTDTSSDIAAFLMQVTDGMCSCVAERQLATVSADFVALIFRTNQFKSVGPTPKPHILEQKCLKINIKKTTNRKLATLQ
jgi:hypothetical protein